MITIIISYYKMLGFANDNSVGDCSVTNLSDYWTGDYVRFTKAWSDLHTNELSRHYLLYQSFSESLGHITFPVDEHLLSPTSCCVKLAQSDSQVRGHLCLTWHGWSTETRCTVFGRLWFTIDVMTNSMSEPWLSVQSTSVSSVRTLPSVFAPQHSSSMQVQAAC